MTSLKKISLSALLATVAVTPSIATTGTGSTTAVINMDTIMTQSLAAKTLNTQISDMQKSIREGIYQQEEALRKEQASLKNFKGKELEQKKAGLEAKAAGIHRGIVKKNESLQKAAQQAYIQIGDTVTVIAKSVANQKGFEYVQPSSQFISYPETSDITVTTIAELNKKLPTIKVSMTTTPTGTKKS